MPEPSTPVRDEPSPEWVALAPGLHIRRMVEGNGCAISLYRLDTGRRFERHHHPFPELGVVLVGRARMTIGDEERTLREGDSYFIPGGTPHGMRVVSHGPVVVMGVTSSLPPDIEGPSFAEVLEVAQKAAGRDSEIASSDARARA